MRNTEILKRIHLKCVIWMIGWMVATIWWHHELVQFLPLINRMFGSSQSWFAILIIYWCDGSDISWLWNISERFHYTELYNSSISKESIGMSFGKLRVTVAIPWKWQESTQKEKKRLHIQRQSHRMHTSIGNVAYTVAIDYNPDTTYSARICVNMYWTLSIGVILDIKQIIQ